MLRITHIEANGASESILRLDGHVSGPWVEELRRECEAALAGGPDHRLVLDLANVSYVDADGVALFLSVTARSGRLEHCTPFVREQLKELPHDVR